MQRLRISRILAVLALLSCLLPSFGAGAAWFCEGRQCGTSLWRCCCISTGTLRDPNCGKQGDASSRTVNKKAKAAMCPAGCNCVMVSADAPASHVAIAVTSIFPPLVLLPLPTPIYSVSSVSELLLFGKETRGPPRQPLVFANLSLRAPPIA
jgi:hypothetical protein